MKKKISLKRIFHRGAWRYAIVFNRDEVLTGLVRSVRDARWSQTNKCWYTDDNEENLKQILAVFRQHAEIDISAIVSGDETEDSSLASVENDSKENKEKIPESAHDILSKNPSEKSNYGTGTFAKKYGAVLFTINEPDGRLVIKFTGRYDSAWITEMNLYGKIYYDKSRKEWLLHWSQLTVDSLSDYFSSRGVGVIVKRREVSQLIKEIRDKDGNDVRDRVLAPGALEAIDHLRRYLEEKRYSNRTIGSYTAHLELFLKYFHEKEPGDISESDISGFIEDYIIRLGYSASYQNLIISAIKLYYSISEERMVDLGSITRPRRSRALPKVFSKEEVLKIFSATKNSKHKLILWIIYSCGLRRSEVTNIKLTDLDTERGVLHIRKGKGNIDRMVPVPQKIWEKIRIYMKSYNPVTYLFEGRPGGRYSVESVYSVFKQSLRNAGIRKDVGVHCLRHSYATHLHESGLDIRYIQELLGHKSTRTTEIYTHVSRRNLFAIRSPIEDIDLE